MQNFIVFESDLAAFVHDIIDIFGGPNHDLRVCVTDSGAWDTVEVVIFGDFPRELRRGLRRVYVYGEIPKRGALPWILYDVIWCTRRDGSGTRYGIQDLGKAIDLIAERRLLKDGGSV